MAVKITYLLGAGASAEALPLIKRGKDAKPGLPDALKQFVERGKDAIEKHNNGEFEYNSLLQIAVKCIEFGTPDLYAKFLVETGDDDNYDRLKRLLSNYFMFEQTESSYDLTLPTGPRFDKRALTFLTTISGDRKLPEEVNILSWNYDIQIELAAEKLRNYQAPQGQWIRNFSAWPNILHGENPLNKESFLLHLNGVAGYDYSARDLCTESEAWYDFKKSNVHPLLSFAWEDESRHGRRTFLENRIQKAKRMVAGTEILVVVGYSFPFFNRTIDKEIFVTMKDSLSSIYFQDPFLDGSQLYAQFGLSRGFAVVHIPYVDNYYVPFEL